MKNNELLDRFCIRRSVDCRYRGGASVAVGKEIVKNPIIVVIQMILGMMALIVLFGIIKAIADETTLSDIKILYGLLSAGYLGYLLRSIAEIDFDV